jgi:Flp pilus assembly protein TadD
MTAAARASIALIIGTLCRGQDYDRLLREQRPAEVIPKLRSAAAGDRNAALALGVAYYMARQYRLFERQMRDLIAKAPDDPAPYYYLGRYQDADLGDFAAAAVSFREVLARRPHHAKARYYLGHALEAQGQAAEARRCFEQARQSDPGLAVARDGLARLELAAGDAEAALAHDPADAGLRGRILVRLERWTEAERALREAAEADTTDASVWFLLQRTYQRLGEADKARAALEHYRILSRTY